MKIPSLSALCKWSVDTKRRVRLQHQREVNHNSLRSDEPQTKQTLNSSKRE